MATKAEKKIVPKGQRLGWTPIKDAKHVVISSGSFKGRRVVANVRSSEAFTSLLIP